MSPVRSITILGGGPAGLAAAYFARQRGLPFRLFEAGSFLGGNCATFRHGAFRYDSGAHRFHDVHPEVTRELRQLLGEDLRPVTAPSQVYVGGRMVDFPLAPADLLRKLGWRKLAGATLDFAVARMRPGPRSGASFDEVVRSRYGRSIAELFLLNYSEKLWGRPCHQLSADVAGRRLQGLTLRTFLVELRRGARQRTRHLDGAFYYPRLGYGQISDQLAAAAGREHIQTDARVTRIRHAHQRLVEVEINHAQRVAPDDVVSTLPLDRFLELLEPAPPEPVLAHARRLQFRHLVLVVLFLDQPSVSANASVYFPEKALPFTRISEPRNRSAELSPPGQTSLVIESTCAAGSAVWTARDAELIEQTLAALRPLAWVRPGAILDAEVRRIPCAYPVLELGWERGVIPVQEYLAGFANLRLLGRNARFAYTHLHDQVRAARELVEAYAH